MTNWYEFKLSFEADEEEVDDITDRMTMAYCGRAWWKWRPWDRGHHCRRNQWVGTWCLIPDEEDDEDSPDIS